MSSEWSGGNKVEMGLPTISAAGEAQDPLGCLDFQLVMTPSSVSPMMASSDDWTIAASTGLASSACRRAASAERRARVLSRTDASAAYRSLISWKTSTTPCMRPRSSVMGAAVSSMGWMVPSLAVSFVWLARPTTMPSRSTLVTGFSTGSPVI